MANKTKLEKLPTLSLKERDRRWNLAKKVMSEKGLDCLIATSDGYQLHDGWFANDGAGGIAIFPLKGEPTYVIRRAIHGIMAMEVNRQRGIAPWIEDYQAWGSITDGLVTILKQKGMESANIGTIGLGVGAVGVGGGISYPIWSYVLKQLPGATFTDISMPTFIEMTIVKSEEELALGRQAAAIGELACEAMLKTVKHGVSENLIYANIVQTIIANGGFANLIITHTGTGFRSFAWGWPEWLYQAQNAPVVGKGDLVQAELFPSYGCMQAQQQMSVATKPVSSLVQELAGIARKSYELGLKAIKPGVKFADVYEIMKRPLDEAGCWHLTPMIHSLNPLAVVSPAETRVDELKELKKYRVEASKTLNPLAQKFVIKEGMMLELEPNACRENKQRVNLGGTVIVTKDGVEELNKLSTQMRVAG